MKKLAVVWLCALLTFSYMSIVLDVKNGAEGKKLDVEEPMTGEVTFDIPVQLGWNFISVPLVQANTSILAVLDDDGGDTVWNIAQWYDPTDPIGDYWKTYNVNYAGTQDLTDINHTMGLYLNITDIGSDGYLRVNGSLPSTTIIPLWVSGDPPTPWDDGWNMVGYPAVDDSTLTVADVKASTNVTSVQNYTSELPDNYVLKRGEGYWFNVSQNSTWMLNPFNGTLTVHPDPVNIFTNSLTGSKQISFWSNQSMDSVNVTVLNLNRTEFTNQIVWQDDDDWTNFTSFEEQLASGNTTYSIDLVDCDIFNVHILGYADAPDLDLGIFLDGKNGEPIDGITQTNESVAFDADGDADEYVSIENPEDGTYLIKIFGYTITSEPGHFDMTIDLLSNMTGIFNVADASPSPLAPYTLRYFNLTWDMPLDSQDGEYNGGFYLGTDLEYNITLSTIVLYLDRTAPVFSTVTPGVNEIVDDPKPVISGTFSISDYADIDRMSPKMWLDGNEVTFRSTISIPFDDEVGKYWYGTILYQPEIPLSNGPHTVTITVDDVAGNTATKNWMFTVDSPFQPISHTPEIMTSINYITPINAIIESDFEIQKIELFYKAEGEATFTSASMKKTGTNTYYGDIPAQSETGTLNYYIHAEDVDGNTATIPALDPTTSPYSIQVNDFDFPRISHQPVIVYGDNSFSIQAIVSDNLDIDSATFYFKKSNDTVYSSTQMTYEGGHVYSTTLDPADFRPDDILYYIEATDGTNVVTHPIDVNSPHVILYSQTNVLGGELRVAIQNDIKTTNPLVAGDHWTWKVLDRIYDSAVKESYDLEELIPYIAVGSASQTTKSDPSEYVWEEDLTIGEFTFTPEEHWATDPTAPAGETTIFYDFTNVIWQDGVQMTIRDVLFSYAVQSQLPDWVSSVKNLMDKGGGAGSNFGSTHFLNIYKTYESADGLRAALTFKLQVPYYNFFMETLGINLLPYHIWGSTISGQTTDNTLIWSDPGYTPSHPDAWNSSLATAWDNPNPIGSGPFEWNQRVMGVEVNVTTYRDHFYASGYAYSVNVEQPNIDGVVYKIYKTSEQAVLALRNDEIDYIAWSIPPTFFQELMNDPDIGIMQYLQNGFAYMAYNMRRPSFGYNGSMVDNAKPLREAIAHSIDKQTIVQSLLQNFGIPGNGPVSSISQWYNSSIPAYSFDPEEAKNILQNAGYQLTDGPASTPGPGNWWLNPDLTQIGSGAGGRIDILTPSADYDPVRAQAGLMIAGQLQQIGIYAESLAMDFGTIVQRVQDRDFDMYILGWSLNTEPPEFLYDLFHSSNSAAGQNYPGYQNASFDAMIENARSALDLNERKQYVRDALGSIAYNLPYDVLYFRTTIETYRSDNFIGWTFADDSLLNDESLYNIRQPSLALPSTDMIEEKNTGGELRVALQDEPDTLNPLTSTDEITKTVMDLVYDSLGRVDRYTLEISPWIAKSWVVSQDSTIVTVELHDVKWHDGTALTASDVKHTYDTYALTYINSVAVVDNDTVVFTLNAPNSLFFSEALMLPLFPKGFNGASEVMGSGPFKLKERVNGTSLSLEVFEDYFDGRVNLDSIRFTYYPDDTTTYETWDPRYQGIYRAASDLIEGQLDFIGWDLASNETTMNIDIPYGTWNMTNLIQNGGTSVTRNDGFELHHIGFNTQRTPLNMSAVRKAISYGVDKEALQVFDIGGGFELADSILGQFNHPYWNDTIQKYRYDFERANQILDEAGFFDRDGDGWRDLPYAPYDSFNLTLLGPPVGELTQNVMALVTEGWIQDLGINITLVSNKHDVNWQAINNDDYDLYYESIEGGQYLALLDDLGRTGSVFNYANYADTIMDSLLDKMNNEMNLTLRAQYARDCEGWLAEELPYIPLFHHKVNNAYDTNRFDGWVSIPGGLDNFWSYLNVYPLFDPTPVDAPIALHAYDSKIGSSINLTWSPNNETGVIGYNVYRSDVSRGPYDHVGSVDLITVYQDNTVVDNKAYYYVIAANGSESAYSEEVYAMSTDGIPPTVLSTVPDTNEIDVGNTTDIIVRFSKEMNVTNTESGFSYTNGTTTLTTSDGTVSWNDENDTMAFTPTEPLSHENVYTVTINGSSAQGIAGNRLDGDENGIGGDDYVWQFTVIHDTTPPEVISTIPANNSVNISVVTTIIIEFSKQVDITSVENNLTFEPAIEISEYEWNVNGTTVILVPSANLSRNTTYNITIAAEARDVLENNLVSTYTWSFTTWLDYDADGIPDSVDTDDDNDGFLDEWEEFLGTDPKDPEDMPLDTDGDGIPDGDETNSQPWMDTDDDNDGVADEDDPDPLDPEVTGEEGGPAYMWIIAIIIIAVIGSLAFFKLRGRGKAPADEGAPEISDEPDSPDSDDAQSDGGADSPPPESEPVSEPEPAPQTEAKPASPEPTAEPHPNQEMIDKIQKAFDEGKISEWQYRVNMEKFSKH